jgi:hypothetical protein
VLATVLTLVTEMELARGDEGDLVIDVGLDVTETVSLRTRELVTLSALSLLRSVDQLVVRFNSELEDFLRGTERTVLWLISGGISPAGYCGIGELILGIPFPSRDLLLFIATKVKFKELAGVFFTSRT